MMFVLSRQQQHFYTAPVEVSAATHDSYHALMCSHNMHYCVYKFINFQLREPDHVNQSQWQNLKVLHSDWMASLSLLQRSVAT